jgi:hypothetical protein
MTAIAITCTDWRQMGVDSGHALAGRIFRVPLRFNDETINILLDRAGVRLATYMC